MPLAAIAQLFLAAATLTVSPGVAPVDSRWPEVAYVTDGDCAIVVTGNGRFYRISATGLGSDAPARYVLTNGDMTPIDWQVRADANGRFARYYLPFRWHRRGGEVTVTVSSERCAMSASFPWQRADGMAR
jgi:hypothetical protein